MGKFEGNDSQMKAQAVYEASLSFRDDEVGSVSEQGWHACLVLGKRYAFIVYEDNYGFVDVTTFNNEDDARKAFSLFVDTSVENWEAYQENTFIS